MKKKLYIFLFLIYIHFSFSFAQRNYAMNWIFHKYGGITFKNGLVDTIMGFYNSRSALTDLYEGSATISNPQNGDLLFSTTGVVIFNCKGEVMPNGDSLSGNTSSSSGALIVPAPENDHLFYTFTTDSDDDSLTSGLRYTIVDITLNNGLGDVKNGKKNILLLEKATEKVTAIRYANKKDYWIISSKWGTDEYYVFYLNENGITDTCIYNSGYICKSTFPNFPNNTSNSKGCIKSSPNGNFIASCYWSSKKIMLLRFNNSTGQLYDTLLIDVLGTPYGLSFSPNETKLYLTHFSAGNYKFFHLKEMGDYAKLKFKCFDIFGKEIMNLKVEKDYFEIDTDELAPGVYIYKFISNQGKNSVGKFVKMDK